MRRLQHSLEFANHANANEPFCLIHMQAVPPLNLLIDTRSLHSYDDGQLSVTESAAVRKVKTDEDRQRQRVEKDGHQSGEKLTRHGSQCTVPFS